MHDASMLPLLLLGKNSEAPGVTDFTTCGKCQVPIAVCRGQPSLVLQSVEEVSVGIINSGPRVNATEPKV